MDQINSNAGFLSLGEVNKLLSAVSGRHEARDRCLLLLMFRHSLHVSEACAIQMHDLDLEKGRILIRRTNAEPVITVTYSLSPDEIKALQIWLAVRRRMHAKTSDVFISANRTRLSRKTVWLLMKRHGEQAGLQTSIYPEILRASRRALKLTPEAVGGSTNEVRPRYVAVPGDKVMEEEPVWA